jgi:hypothetical protein
LFFFSGEDLNSSFIMPEILLSSSYLPLARLAIPFPILAKKVLLVFSSKTLKDFFILSLFIVLLIKSDFFPIALPNYSF